MSNNNNDGPVRVTGQERRHPALRILARACISIARDQMEAGKQADGQERAEVSEPSLCETEEGAA